MLSTAGVIFIALLIIIVLTQIVSIQITKRDSFLLCFNFIFLQFSLDTKENNQKQKQGKKKEKPKVSSILRTVSFGLSRSHVELRAFDYPGYALPRDSFLLQGAIRIPASMLLAYLISSSASFERCEPCDEDATIDATVYTPLFHLIFTALFYFKAQRKTMRKERARQLKSKTNRLKTK